MVDLKPQINSKPSAFFQEGFSVAKAALKNKDAQKSVSFATKAIVQRALSRTLPTVTPPPQPFVRSSSKFFVLFFIYFLIDFFSFLNWTEIIFGVLVSSKKSVKPEKPATPEESTSEEFVEDDIVLLTCDILFLCISFKIHLSALIFHIIRSETINFRGEWALIRRNVRVWELGRCHSHCTPRYIPFNSFQSIFIYSEG